MDLFNLIYNFFDVCMMCKFQLNDIIIIYGLDQQWDYFLVKKIIFKVDLMNDLVIFQFLKDLGLNFVEIRVIDFIRYFGMVYKY